LTSLEAELQDIIDQLLTKMATCAPSIIMNKPKFHFLLHLPYYICQFGPALLFSTECYESFNMVFRLSLIHSNCQVPSRDCAITFAQLNRVKHIALGGWWYNKNLKKYTCATRDILNVILHMPEYAWLLGLPSVGNKVPGM
jgi:hypothetical protein